MKMANKMMSPSTSVGPISLSQLIVVEEERLKIK